MEVVSLQVGDIIVDQITGNIGLLMERVLLTNGGADDVLALWAWEVYWIGSDICRDNRLTTWTEFGLLSIIKTGTYRHHGS